MYYIDGWFSGVSMSVLRLSILLFFLFTAGSAYPTERIFTCGAAKDVMKQNMIDGYAYFATATENNGFVIQLFMNLRNGDWRIVGIDGNMRACNMLKGIDWNFLKISGTM